MNWLLPKQDLTRGQIHVVEAPFNRHRIVVGSPGSGKTMLLLHRAHHLATSNDIPASKFKLFAYTNALKKYIGSALVDLSIPDECVMTFDHWCRLFHQQNVAGRLPWKNKGPDFDAIRTNVRDELRRRGSPVLDFVMVDEGQDLDSVAYDILKCAAKHITVAMDNKQQLYDYGSTVQDVRKNLELEEHAVSLLDAYRCSPYVVRVASRFITSDTERLGFIEQNQPKDVGQRQLPLVYFYKNTTSAFDHFVNALQTSIDVGDRIGILAATRRRVYSFAKALNGIGVDVEIPANYMRGDSEEMQEHDFTSNKPKLMPFPSAKGLTFDAVFMPEYDRYGFPESVSPELLNRWFFVAITRAIRWVYFSTSSNGMFNERFVELEKEGQLNIAREVETTEEKVTDQQVGENQKQKSEPSEDLSNLF